MILLYRVFHKPINVLSSRGDNAADDLTWFSKHFLSVLKNIPLSRIFYHTILYSMKWSCLYKISDNGIPELICSKAYIYCNRITCFSLALTASCLFFSFSTYRITYFSLALTASCLSFSTYRITYFSLALTASCLSFSFSKYRITYFSLALTASCLFLFL
jgi:hypothetical protein